MIYNLNVSSNRATERKLGVTYLIDRRDSPYRKYIRLPLLKCTLSAVSPPDFVVNTLLTLPGARLRFPRRKLRQNHAGCAL